MGLKDNNKFIADFDETVQYKPYKNNSFVDISFNTYDECKKWIMDQAHLPFGSGGYNPELGWKLGSGEYHRSWEWLMPVIIQICKIKTPDYTYESGERVFVEQIYLRTFGMLDGEGFYMVRFNGFSLYKSKSLIEATYQGVLEVIKNIKTWKENQ